MQNLKNCPRCGTLFVQSFRPICQQCYKELEEKFKMVYSYLRERQNHQASMREIADETGVSDKDITRFIKEGRIPLHQLPNLKFPCESCGREIREGRLCLYCKDNIRTGVEAHERKKELLEKEKEKKRKLKQTYHSLNDRLK